MLDPFTTLAGHLTKEPEDPCLIPGPATFVKIDSSHFDDSRRAVVSYWCRHVHLVLVRKCRWFRLNTCLPRT